MAIDVQVYFLLSMLSNLLFKNLKRYRNSKDKRNNCDRRNAKKSFHEAGYPRKLNSWFESGNSFDWMEALMYESLLLSRK